ncbi:hypothetical protein Q8W71_16090 [Methylobacterium sp. NEAU 140]|uniref:hypothetical protein n=1 Tax=Methylobacterium sp. NEAU 140 TaxID=3064945 RepID=UPI0027374081|nr:hypothetical protein [Methylobacterium sp. NEAU 140]MDP4024150.1 hypothetical protein [Methylobacterium sp. NEAU 140]
MDLSATFQTIIGAGIGSAIIQAVIPAFRDWRKQSAQASYLALRLAVTLEAFASASCDLIAVNENAPCSPDHAYPRWTTKLPALAEFPPDQEGWLALDRDLAERALAFRNRVSKSQSVISDTAWLNEGALGASVETEAMERGLEAWRLASDLRTKHRAKAARPIWDYAAKLESIEARQKEYMRENNKQP